VRRFVVSDSRCKESRFVGRIVVCRKDSRMYEGQLYVGRTVVRRKDSWMVAVLQRTFNAWQRTNRYSVSSPFD
jgi:hypothetical protein